MQQFIVGQSEQDVSEAEQNLYAGIRHPELIRFYVLGPILEIAAACATVSVIGILLARVLIS